jgi:hypothetical protein
VAIWEDGIVRLAGQIRTTPESLPLFEESLCEKDEVALEATRNTHAIARLLACLESDEAARDRRSEGENGQGRGAFIPTSRSSVRGLPPRGDPMTGHAPGGLTFSSVRSDWWLRRFRRTGPIHPINRRCKSANPRCPSFVPTMSSPSTACR